MAALVLVLEAVIVRRVFASAIEADRDVGLYVVQARELLRGGWPIVAVWDLHPIGEPVLIAAAFALLGQSVEAARLLGAVTVGAGGLILGRLVARSTRSDGWGLVAGSIYVLHTSVSGGLAANNEVVLAPFVIGGVALTLRQADRALQGRRPSVPGMLCPGLCFGLALWIKQVAAPEAAVAFASLVLLGLRTGGLRPGRVPVLAAVFGAACAGPTLLTALAYHLAGHFPEYYQATVLAPLRTGDARSVPLILAASGIAATRFAPLLVLALVAAVALGRRWPVLPGRDRLLPATALLWLVAAAAGVLVPPRPYGHHFLLLLPPLSLLATLGLMRLLRWRRVFGPGRVWSGLLAGVFVCAVPGLTAVFHARTTPRIDALRQVALTLGDVVAPGETIFVVNANPVLYFLSGAALPGRYIFPDHLVDPRAALIPGLDADAEVAGILDRAPGAIVLDRASWASLRSTVRALVTARLAAGYTRAGAGREGLGTLEVYGRRP